MRATRDNVGIVLYVRSRVKFVVKVAYLAELYMLKNILKKYENE